MHRIQIIPVMDLKGGRVVQAIGGRRDEYQPIRSQLVDSSEPVAVARTFLELGLEYLYLADLDAISGADPALETYRRLADLGSRLLIDAGVRSAASARAVHATGADGVVLGLETTADPNLLRAVATELPNHSTWFSLDLKGSKPICSPAWPQEPEKIADLAVRSGMRQLIVLDLARVGEGQGIGTEPLCRGLVTRHPAIRLVAGGGIRNDDDLSGLATVGAWGAIVATAIHTRRITLPRFGRSGVVRA